MTRYVAETRLSVVMAVAACAAGAVPARATHAVYVERYQAWAATAADTWQTQSLAAAPYSVPANAVVEVAIYSLATGNERYGGVRRVGSGLDRRLLIQEAEGGGSNVVVMHVQTDANSQIQHYSDVVTTVGFILLGYWRCGTYVERFDTFTAGASTAWTDRNLAPFGVAAGDVAEIVLSNENANNEREAGVRTNGSALGRLLDLQEAEEGGRSLGSLLVNADGSANATVELYAEADADVDFFLVGYWTNAPGTFTETFSSIGGPAASATWQDKSVAASGAPAHAILEMVPANGDVDAESMMGARKNGSALNRVLDLQEAEAGGRDVGRLHVRVDGGQNIEVYHEALGNTPFEFLVTGYWTVTAWYSLTDLGSLTGDPSLAERLNASAQVVGFDEDAATDDETAWRHSGGGLTGLGTLGGKSSEARAINDAGNVVGWAHIPGDSRRAFHWTSGGGMTDLGVLVGHTDSEAFGVNAGDEVVGVCLDYGVPPESRLAFLYLPLAAYGLPAGMNSLGTLGDGGSMALDINDAGEVVGGSAIGGNLTRPFLWLPAAAYGLPAGMNDLGTLGGESNDATHRAKAVSNAGEVVGLSYTAGGDAHAFLWLPAAAYGLSAGMNDLGTLPGGTTSWAFGINSGGEIVGMSDWSGADYRAFIWETGTITDLNDLIDPASGWTLIRATDVNDAGQIVGWGVNGAAATHAFLLTPDCFVTAFVNPPYEPTGGDEQPSGDDDPPDRDDQETPDGDPVCALSAPVLLGLVGLVPALAHRRSRRADRCVRPVGQE